MLVVIAHSAPEARLQLREPLDAFGYDVLEAESAAEVLAACRARRPEAAIVHEDLAHADGDSLLDELKGDPDAFTTAVILVAREELDSERALDELRRGVQDFLLEPVAQVEILARVRSAARTKILQEELVGQTRRLETMLHEDMLTGLFNRRYTLTRLAGLISGARRHGRPLSVAMVDIDHFKALNDAHGHEAGDLALVAVAAALRERLRAEDELGRLGGEEFLALLPDTDEQAAAAVAESIRESVEGLTVRLEDLELRLTVSVGWSTWDGEEDDDGIVRRADQALYQAKNEGRNRVRGGPGVSATLRRRT